MLSSPVSSKARVNRSESTNGAAPQAATVTTSSGRHVADALGVEELRAVQTFGHQARSRCLTGAECAVDPDNHDEDRVTSLRRPLCSVMSAAPLGVSEAAQYSITGWSSRTEAVNSARSRDTALT
jgi:hypothetical protein